MHGDSPMDEHCQQMVDQLAQRGIADVRVLAAMARIPREKFVLPELQHRAYADEALPTVLGQTISQPFIVAYMTQALTLQGGESVLEIGTGTGYQTSILAQLCAQVVTMERIPQLAASAIARLRELGISNVEFHVGDGTLGYPPRAPYDAIIVTAGAPEVPAPLYQQLKTGGRLVIPVGDDSEQVLQLIERRLDGPEIYDLGGCRFVKLIGDAGWQAAER